jgi:hypothetical protein
MIIGHSNFDLNFGFETNILPPREARAHACAHPI